MIFFSKLPRYLTFSFCALFLSVSCKENLKSQNQENQTAAKTETAAAQPVILDSTFVIDYIKNEPEFKDHEQLVRLFYRTRGWRIGWFKNGEPVPQTQRFMEVVNAADKEGLNPKDYKVKDFNALLKKYDAIKDETAKKQLMQEIDVALTASYFNYGTDFYKGIVDPRKNSNINWKVKKNKIKLNKALQTILKERESKYPYYEFAPLHEGYNRLRASLQKHRDLLEKGAWPVVPEVKKLKSGESSPIVPVLRQRLLMQYEPQKAAAISSKTDTAYDVQLELLVKKFQELHGLKPDGVVGPGTIKALNVSLEDRIDQIIINMERWRWIPKKFEDKYIFVNIPEYVLRIFENKKEALSMKVIVGKELNSTPIFSDKLEYIVFSPYWNVPNSIIENEIKPAMLRNPNFLESQDMEIVTEFSKKGKRISASAIDWASVTEKNFKYRIRQRPGPKNSLGLVKFMFPNEFNVYLHDTPNGYLFNQTERGFSHGCVRVEQPAQLAAYLLKDKPQWDMAAIEQAMNAREEQYINLKEKVPVYIVYFTSWVDETGNIHFRDDLYGHDKKLKNEYFN